MNLKIENVSLAYDGRPILRNVNAEVKNSKVVSFLGPSGVGKTQLLRILAGLKSPDSGRVTIDTNTGSAYEYEVQPGNVGLVAQNYPLFAHRSVLSNLLLTGAAKESAMHYLELYKLADHKDNYPAQLSGGQRQRIAILQMVLSNSPFILMDEPFASLDMIMLELTCQTIVDMSKHDKTILVVTHDITAAASISDRLWLLGHERDAQGNAIPGARLVESFNVEERGIQYEAGIITRTDFLAFVAEVKNRFRSL